MGNRHLAVLGVAVGVSLGGDENGALLPGKPTSLPRLVSLRALVAASSPAVAHLSAILHPLVTSWDLTSLQEA